MELAAAAKLSSYAHEPRTRSVELRAAQVRQIYSQSVPALIGAQLSAVVFVIALWNVVAHWLLLAWLAVYFALQLVRNSIVRAFNRTAPSDEHAALWGTRFSAITIAAGLTWGMTGIFLFPATAIARQVIVAVFLSGISAAAMAAYFPLKQCYVPTIMAECLPLAFRCFYEFDQVHFIMGSVMVLYCTVLILTGNCVHALFGERLRLGFEKNDLLSSVLEQQNELRTLNRELTEQIEERTRAEQSLTENEARYRELAELLPQLIFELDPEGKFRFVNRAGLEMMGRTVADVDKGLFPIEVCVPPDRDEADLHVSDALSGKVISGAECDLTRSDGTTVPVIIYATPIILDGTITGVRAVGVDVSDLKAAQEKLLASLKEKELLLREIHHRVKNNLQVVCSLLRVQRRRIGDQEFAAMFQESEDRIASMAAVYEKLYQSDNLAELNARDYLTSVVRYIRGTYEIVGKSPDLRTDLQDLTLAPDSAIPLGLIATELIANSLKHAFPEPATGQVNVILRRLNTARVELVVSDNGSGLPEQVGPDDCTSLGLRLVRIFTNQLGGEIRISRNGGTSISVQFDRPEAERGREAQNHVGTTSHSRGRR